MSALLEILRPWLAALGTATVSVLVLTLLHLFLRQRREASRFAGQVVGSALTLVALIAVIAALPLGEGLRGQILSLLGLLLSGAFALSSTTFVGNAMAGMMLRVVRNFRPGDFIQVGDHLGRVSERGLFHTEIQTENSDLTTLPNLYLVTQPVTVVRASGTIVSATVSLGYDVAHGRIRAALLRAAAASELEDGFVQVTALGDFSVTYRVAGLLRKVTTLLSARSHLREAMLDALHGDGIEIVSPTFMNTRSLSPDRRVVPKPAVGVDAPAEAGPPPEAIVFEKAEEAASTERLRELLAKATEELSGLEQELKQAEESAQPKLQARKETLAARMAHLQTRLEAREASGPPA